TPRGPRCVRLQLLPRTDRVGMSRRSDRDPKELGWPSRLRALLGCARAPRARPRAMLPAALALGSAGDRLRRPWEPPVASQPASRAPRFASSRWAGALRSEVSLDV